MRGLLEKGVWVGTLLVALTPLLAYGQAKDAPPPPPAEKPAGAPVLIEGQELFRVQERVLSFSPEDRAAAIGQRIGRLARDPLVRPDSIVVEESEVGSAIVSGDVVIMVVTDADARAAGKPRPQLAQEYAFVIRAALGELQEEHSLRSLILGGVFALLSTVVLLLILALFKRLFPPLYALVRLWKGTRIRSLRFQRLELLSAERLTELIVLLLRVIRVATVVVLLYFYLPLVFSFFPWTRGYATVLFGYVLSPLREVVLAFASFVPNLFFIFVIVGVSYYFIKFLRFIFVEIERGTIVFPGFYAEWAVPTYRIVRFLVIAFAAVVIFPYLPGSDSPAFRGISIFLGVLFSLGSTAAVANVVAGVILTYMRPFKLGDRVRIADTVGDVIEKDLLVTRIQTIKNVSVTVPNAMVLGSHIINYSTSAQESGLILHTSVTIGYDAPWRKVHELLIAAARATEGILAQPEPFVFQTALDDFFVRYELNAYTDQPNRMAVTYSELHQNIQDKFNEGGVEIMSPHYSALRDGNQTTIPEDHLPSGYQAPAFRVLPLDGPPGIAKPPAKTDTPDK